MTAGQIGKKRKKPRKLAEKGFIAVIVAPAILYFGVIFYYPTIMNIYYMFCDYNLIKDPEFVGLKNIIRFFSDPLALGAFRNTFIITIVSVPVVIIAALLIGTGLSKITRGVGFFRSAIFAAYLTSLTVAAIVFKSWFGTESGFINGVLTQLGGSKIPWLAQPSTAMAIVIVLSVWKNVGYYVVVFLAGFSNVDTGLYEAAKIDGANSRKIFFSITIPQLIPTIIYSSIIAMINFLRTYSSVLVLTNGGPYSSTQTVLMYMFDQGFSSRNVGYASVISVALTLVILVLTVIQMRMSHMMDEEGAM